MSRYHRTLFRIISTYLLVFALTLLVMPQRSIPVIAQDNPFTRRVNVPYLGSAPPVENFRPAIFWFGKVGLTSNYADVRVYYYDNYLNVVVHIIDRLLWYDTSHTIPSLDQWDAVSLYIDLDGNTGIRPDTNAYRLVSQLNFWEPQELWRARYHGNGTTWVSDPVTFTAESIWRGNGPNDDITDSGWVVKYTIPFSSLGLAGKPPYGTIWGLAVALHDRDDAEGSIITDQLWPENMEPNIPNTWGQMFFGIPVFEKPNALPDEVITIRQGLNGITVVDGHVGGHTICGANTNYWLDWGDTNYAGYSQINIQNQWDIADSPCFSKYYVTFPLDSLPPGKVIINASVFMTLFGNAGGGIWGEPPDSYVEVFTVAEDWGETNLTWNNAPLAIENISGTWVYPRDYDLPDQTYQWDVSRALYEAYEAGNPLRLALYSIDGERHSGKYFWSSDTGDWNALARPTLRVIFGKPCETPGFVCSFTYLPAVNK